MHTYRKTFNEQVKRYGNVLHEGLGDLLTKEIDPRKAAATACIGLVAMSPLAGQTAYAQTAQDSQTVEEIFDGQDAVTTQIDRIDDHIEQLQEAEGKARDAYEEASEAMRYFNEHTSDEFQQLQEQREDLLGMQVDLTYRICEQLGGQISRWTDVKGGLQALSQGYTSFKMSYMAGDFPTDQFEAFDATADNLVDTLEGEELTMETYRNFAEESQNLY